MLSSNTFSNNSSNNSNIGISIGLPMFNNKDRLNQRDGFQRRNASAINRLSGTQESSNNSFNTQFESIKRTLFLDNIMYEKFLFYAVLCLITFNIVFEFLYLMKKSLQRRFNRCTKNKKPKSPEPKSLYSHEIAYTTQIFTRNTLKPISFARHLFEKYIYKNHPDFR